MITVRSLKKGSYFVLRDDLLYSSESQVWVRGLYDPSMKAYECFRFDDVSRTRYFKGDRIVFVISFFDGG